MDSMNVEKTREMIMFLADRIIESKPYLTEIDSRIGDGDHGIGMETGFLKVKNVIGQKEYTSINDLFRDVGMAMLNSMGGASGVIFSTIYLGGIKGIPVKDVITASDYSEIMSGSLDMIKQRGKANVGDKTMVDALEPACIAMSEYVTRGSDFEGMLAAGENAAKRGMEATKDYAAKFGRAKSLMERSIGYQDAGATSVYLMFRAMREWTGQYKGA